jgi:Domain of unknown function (DUF4340)
MKQTTKTLFGLLALVVATVGLAAAARWVGKDEAKKVEAREKREKLFDFDKSHVKSLRLWNNGQFVAEIEKVGKDWKLQGPVKADADNSAVDSILGALLAMKEKRELSDEKSGSAFGLDTPIAEVAVTLDDGRTLGLQLGTDTRFDNTVYVRKTGEPTIRLIDAFQRPHLEMTPFDLRDKEVAHLPDAAGLETVELRAVKAPYTLRKDGTGWTVNGAAADNAIAERVWSSVRGLRATAIASEDGANLAPFGLNEPKAVVRVSAALGKDSVSRTLLIAQAGGGTGSMKTYAKRDDSPVVYEVDQQILADVDKDPFELANKELVHVERDAIRKLVFESPAGGKVEIGRTTDASSDGGDAEEAFSVISPKHGPTNPRKIDSVLYSIVGMHATAFYGPVPAPKDLARYGLDRPKTVTVLGEGDKVLARLRFGAEKGGKRLAVSDGFDKLAGVERGPVDGYPWNVAEALDTASAREAGQLTSH